MAELPRLRARLGSAVYWRNATLDRLRMCSGPVEFARIKAGLIEQERNVTRLTALIADCEAELREEDEAG